ncbi:hypothetical protein ACNI3Q_09455 [Sphingomonas sp. FW199]|uniref:hypothetical protein n=1 Tax=Sphingomonas sp. FW199 TaxID=3400217 RepID=UPI003CF52E52
MGGSRLTSRARWAVDREPLPCYFLATVLQQSTTDRGQVLQRVRVGLTGLTIVVLLILVAAIIYRSASREVQPDVIGQPNPDVVANMTMATPVANVAGPTDNDEPLATLGVAPSARPKEDAVPADPAADQPTPQP